MRPQLWQRAASYAATMHHHKYRDDGVTPYFSHPARVAMIVSQVFGCGDEVAIAAAYLHDVIEDTDQGYDDVEEQFGPEVTRLVVALTKSRMLPKKERDQDYVERLREADWRARLVKLADQFDNYTDALDGRKERLADVRRKCRSILELAKGDALEHPETSRGMNALTQLCKVRTLRS